MLKRELIRFGLIAAVGTTAFVVCLWQQPRPTFRADDLVGIQEGMTLADVERILGYPPGDYSSGPLIDCEKEQQIKRLSESSQDALNCGMYDARWNKIWLLDDNHYGRDPKDRGRIKAWITDTGMFWIRLDDDGRICQKDFYPNRRRPFESPLQMFSDCLEACKDARVLRGS